MALTDKLSAIGNAIRSKTGGSDLLTLDEMPQEIEGIQTGGGGGEDAGLADSIVNRTIVEYSSESITTVGDYAFRGCSKLQKAIIPNATRIGTQSFYSCSKLSEVDISNVTYLGEYAFHHCDELKEIAFLNLSTISSYCFQDSGVEKVTLGKSVGTIGSYGVFNGCESLTALILLRDSSPCTLKATSNLSSSAISSGTGYIYVPKALIDQYKVATNWVTYANQFRAIEDYPDICGTGE